MQNNNVTENSQSITALTDAITATRDKAHKESFYNALNKMRNGENEDATNTQTKKTKKTRFYSLNDCENMIQTIESFYKTKLTTEEYNKVFYLFIKKLTNYCNI